MRKVQKSSESKKSFSHIILQIKEIQEDHRRSEKYIFN